MLAPPRYKGGALAAEGFSRVSEEFVEGWARAGVSTSALILILLLRYQKAEESTGRIYGSMPRKVMASRLGCSEEAIRKSIERLKSKGLIEVRKTGHSGLATEYYIYGSPRTVTQNRVPPEGRLGSPQKGTPLEIVKKEEGLKPSSANPTDTDSPKQSAAVPRGFEAAQPSELSDPWDIDSEDAVNAYIDGRYANDR